MKDEFIKWLEKLSLEDMLFAHNWLTLKIDHLESIMPTCQKCGTNKNVTRSKTPSYDFACVNCLIRFNRKQQ